MATKKATVAKPLTKREIAEKRLERVCAALGIPYSDGKNVWGEEAEKSVLKDTCLNAVYIDHNGYGYDLCQRAEWGEHRPFGTHRRTINQLIDFLADAENVLDLAAKIRVASGEVRPPIPATRRSDPDAPFGPIVSLDGRAISTEEYARSLPPSEEQ